jgi:hypothetical protein
MNKFFNRRAGVMLVGSLGLALIVGGAFANVRNVLTAQVSPVSTIKDERS